MSSRAPVTGDQALRDAFTAAEASATFGFLNIGIDFETNKFIVIKTAEKDANESDEQLWGRMLALCPEKKHTYFMIRDPTKNIPKQVTDKNNANDPNQSHNLYILIHYAPDLSAVKQRMMYASSRPSLKAFLGNANFSEDYHCSSIEEFSLKRLINVRTLHHKIDFRSESEIEKEQATMESAPKSATSQVMSNLPIEMTESAKNAIQSYISTNCKCVFLTLNAGNQSVEGSEQKGIETVEEIQKNLEPNQPKYILFWYKKSSNNEEKEKDVKEFKEPQRIFGYYCPEKADRKLKFTYSTCKANVINYCNAIDLKFYSKVELSTKDEMTEQFLEYHIFPSNEKKEVFAMPKAPKQRRKSKSKKRKKINVDDM